MRTRREWHRFQVVMTGAFLTGVPLQVRLSDYSRLQHELREELADDAGPGWDGGPDDWRNVPSYKYGGGGYSSLVPLVLVRREGAALGRRMEELQSARPQSEQEWLAEATAGWTWDLRSVGVQLYDLGVGVTATVYDVSTPTWLDPASARRTVESLGRLRPDRLTGVQSPIAAAHKELVRESASAFREAVGKHANGALREPWLAPLLSALGSEASNRNSQSAYQPALEGEWGRLLWLHPVYVLAARDGAPSRQLRRLGQPFKSTYSQAVDFPKGTFIPGIDWSVVAVRGDIAGQEVPVKLIALHWAYYALFMEMDRGLLATLDSDKWHVSDSLGALEDDADRMFRLYMRVKEARARLDSALTDLGGGQLSLWNTIAHVTKFEELVTSVEGKIKVLQRIAEHRVQEAAAARERRTGRILSGLTALTVVTVMIALLGNFFGTKTDALGHPELRVLVVLLAFLLAVILYREAQRDLFRRPRLRERPVASSASRED